MTRWSHLVGVVVVAVAAGLAAGAASAQEDGLSDAVRRLPQFRPSLTAADFDAAADRMAFTDADGRTLFRAVYDDFRRAFDAALAAAQADMAASSAQQRAWRAENPDAPWNAMPYFGYMEAWNGWMTRREAIEREFRENVHAVIGKDQRDVWERITRDLRIRRALEDVDRQLMPWAFEPAEVMMELGIEPEESPAIAAGYDEWVAGFERALIGYVEAAAVTSEWQQRPENRDRWRTDPDRMQREAAPMWMASDDARYALRDAAGRVDPLADALGEDRGSALREHVLRRRFPGVFVQSPVEALSKRLADLPLSPATRDAVERIIADYHPVQRAMRLKLVSAYEREETPGNRRKRQQRFLDVGMDAQRRNAYLDNMPPEDQHGALPVWLENRNLAHATCRRIRAAIPPAEIDALPPGVRLLLAWAE